MLCSLWARFLGCIPQRTVYTDGVECNRRPAINAQVKNLTQAPHVSASISVSSG
jgi:hypothetical protein